MKACYIVFLLFGATSAFADGFANRELVGLSASLVDEERIESYRFGENGIVAAQIGKVSGPITGPAFRWKIQTDHLVITDGDKVIQNLELVDRTEKTFKVRRASGETVVFAIDRKK
jgi:hypothetical protein